MSQVEKKKILVVERGIDDVLDLENRLYMNYSLMIPKLPCSKKEGIMQLKELIQVFKPDLLLAMCRGTYYAMNLVRNGYWKGPVLLLSPQWYDRFPEMNSCPILIVHGTKDSCQRFSNIKGFVDQVKTPNLVKLVPLEGQEHALPAVLRRPEVGLVPYIREALKRKNNWNIKKKKKKGVRKNNNVRKKRRKSPMKKKISVNKKKNGGDR